MRFIPTSVHGVLDYLVGTLLFMAPWLLHFASGGADTLVPVTLGLATILYSFFTDYELGPAKAISMPTHLWMDVGAGALLAVSPWLFGFSEVVFWPHLLVGLFEIAVALTTKTVPGYRQARAS